jgi:phage protein D
MLSRTIDVVVTIAGSPVRATDVSVKMTKTQEPDTAQGTIPLRALASNRQLAYWASVKTAPITIVARAGFEGGLLFDGEADSIDASLGSGTVRFSARDKSQKAMDTKVTKGYRNKTTSGLIKEIAGKHGLEADISEIADKAGKVHNLDFVKMVDQWSDWTTIAHLADLEGLVAFTHKNKLIVRPLDEDADGSFDLVYAPPTEFGAASSNVIQDLSFRRNLECGRPTEVNIHSRHTKTNKSLHSKSAIGGSGALRKYEDRVAGIKTKDHGDRIAKKRLRERTRHELTVNYTGPGSLSLTPLKTLSVSGTQSAFDQSYFIDTAEHHFSPSGGYTVRVVGRNTSKGRA